MGDFFDVPLTEHPTSAGPVHLPVRYREATMYAVMWRVPLAGAEGLLAGKAIEPWPILGKAFVALYVWSYRDSSLGPYEEIGLGILSRRRGTRPSVVRMFLSPAKQEDQGVWVQTLPVTTETAFIGGVELLDPTGAFLDGSATTQDEETFVYRPNATGYVYLSVSLVSDSGITPGNAYLTDVSLVP